MHKMWIQIRRMAFKAINGFYPEQKSLIERYPPNAKAFVTHYSSVELPDEAFVKQPRKYHEDKHE